MGKLAKSYGKYRALAKSGAGKGKEALSSHGHEILEVTGAVGLMVADKNLGPSAGNSSLPAHPSTIAAGIGAGMLAMGKGKTRKLGRTILKSAVISTAARFVYTENYSVIAGTDGNPRIVAGGEKRGAPAPAPAPIVIDAAAIARAIREAEQAERDADAIHGGAKAA